jgi:hypothetical protein
MLNIAQVNVQAVVVLLMNLVAYQFQFRLLAMFI